MYVPLPRSTARRFLALGVLDSRRDPLAVLLVVPFLGLDGLGVGDVRRLVDEPSLGHHSLLVDDLDLVITGGGNPLQPLARFLPHARDIGLSVVLARRSAGASRALFDPFVARIRDLGGAGLVMSGSREEGPLLGGVRPGPLPAGRGRLVTRDGGVRLVQTALSEP